MSDAESAAPGDAPGAAARAEAGEETRTLEAHGITLELPPKLPFKVLRHMRGGIGGTAVVGMLEAIVGPDQLEQIFDLDLDMEEGAQLFSEITALYGTSSGNSSASLSS